MMSGKGCGLWLWHSLNFSLTFFFIDANTTLDKRHMPAESALSIYIVHNLVANASADFVVSFHFRNKAL